MRISRFNLDKLIRDCGKYDIIKIVRNLPYYTGDSYILNYHTLLKCSENTKHKGGYLIDYLVLASFRDYYDYITYGDNSLDARLCPLSDEKIAINPYINRYGKNIIFTLEPSPAELKRK